MARGSPGGRAGQRTGAEVGHPASEGAAGESTATPLADAMPTPSSRTIYAVAKLAGVSIATVSRTLRQSGPVAPATRDRVLAAVAELNFTPSRAGRSLAEGRHAANGIVFPDLSGPYYTEVVLGYEEVTSELGRSVIILSTGGRSAVRDLVRGLGSRVDGMVVFGRTVADDLIEEIVATGLPVVVMARPALPGTGMLTSDNVGGARALTEHLLGHGYTDLRFIGAPTTGDDIEVRWQTVTASLEAAGVPVRDPIGCTFSVDGGLGAGRELLAAECPHAVICANDEVALGVVRAAEELGLAVPDDLAVTGWDDIMAAPHARPALTTVRQPMRELGATAARALEELITGMAEPVRRVLSTELVVRDSCGRHDTS